MELFAKGIIESVKATFSRWRRNGPQITNLVPQSYEGMGENVRLSGDGTVVAIWIPSHNYGNNGLYNGAVRVYKINPSGSSTPMGDILLTDKLATGGTRFGQGMALNYDGTRIAISAPFYDKSPFNDPTGKITIYEFTNSQWTLIGTFLGNQQNGVEGTALDNYGISLNSAGTRLAMFLGYGPPQVKVYDYDGTTWTQVGQTITDSVYATLNANGNVLFTGSKTWNLQNGAWVQTGSFPPEFTTIAGQTAQLTTLGGTFNAAGTRFALRWKFPQTPANWHVLRTYDFSSGAWTQVGTQRVYTTFATYLRLNNGQIVEGSLSQTINPELSGDGSRMILWGNYVKPGQIINAQNPSTVVTGRVMVFDFVGSNWTQQTQVIYDTSVKSAADLSADGKMIAYGLGNNRPRGFTTGSHGVTEVYRKELN